jgi:hypothetical protein
VDCAGTCPLTYGCLVQGALAPVELRSWPSIHHHLTNQVTAPHLQYTHTHTHTPQLLQSPGSYYLRASDLSGQVVGLSTRITISKQARRRQLYGPLMRL